MRFDARRSPSLANDVSTRLQTLAGSRLTQDGVIVITANRHRTQERNRADAIERLVALIARRDRRPRDPPPDAADEGVADQAARGQGEARRGEVDADAAGCSGVIPRRRDAVRMLKE